MGKKWGGKEKSGGGGEEKSGGGGGRKKSGGVEGKKSGERGEKVGKNMPKCEFEPADTHSITDVL